MFATENIATVIMTAARTNWLLFSSADTTNVNPKMIDRVAEIIVKIFAHFFWMNDKTIPANKLNKAEAKIMLTIKAKLSILFTFII